MGLFKFLKKTETVSSRKDYSDVPNQGLKAVATRINKSKDDTVFVSTSRICPSCSMYNRRVYTLYDRTKEFPMLPEFLYAEKCQTCGCSIGFGHYFSGINGNLKKDITFSNRPFVDARTREEKKLWNEKVEVAERNAKQEKDYAWISANLPDLCPKTIGGYKRMANSNSINYQSIVEAAKDKNYLI